MVQVSRAYREEVTGHSADLRLAELAGSQHGVVSLAQLAALGLGKDAVARRLSAGRLHRLHRAVYAVGHGALSSKAHDLAAVLSCGPGAVLSHRSAALRWAMVRHAPRYEVTVEGRRVRRPGIIVRDRSPLAPDDRALIDAIPVTSPARTLVDLAEVLTSAGWPTPCTRPRCSASSTSREIERALARVPGRPGRHKLRRVLAAYDGGPPMTRSEAERGFLRLCEAHSITAPQTNVMVGGYEVDFHWPDARLVVEVDGAATHHTRRAFHADRRRDRALAAAGIQVLRVTWRDLDGGATDWRRSCGACSALRPRARTTRRWPPRPRPTPR